MANLQSKDSSTKQEIDFNDPVAQANHIQELEESIAKKKADIARKSSPLGRVRDILKYPLGVAAGTGFAVLTVFTISSIIAGVPSFGLIPAAEGAAVFAVLGAVAVAATASALYYGVYKHGKARAKDDKELKSLEEELSLAKDPVKAKTRAQEKQTSAELEAMKIAAEVAKSEAEAKRAQAEVQKAQADIERVQAEAVKKSLEISNKSQEDKPVKSQEHSYSIAQVVPQTAPVSTKVVVGKNNSPDFSESKFRGPNANLDAYIIALREAGIEVKGGSSISSSPTSAQKFNLKVDLPYLDSFNFAKMSDMQRHDLFDAVTQNGGPLHKAETTLAVKNAVAGWSNKDVFLGQMPSVLREKTAPTIATSGGEKKFAGTVATKCETHKDAAKAGIPNQQTV